MVKELFSHLRDDALLSSLVDGRIYPQIAPQGVATPFVVYTVIDERDAQADSREVCAVKFLFQLDAYAASYSEAFAVKEAIKKALYLFPAAYPSGLSTRNMPQERDTKLFRELVEFKLKRMEYGSD